MYQRHAPLIMYTRLTLKPTETRRQSGGKQNTNAEIDGRCGEIERN